MKRLAIVVLVLLAIVAAFALRYASQRAEHQHLRELEVGRAPAPAPRDPTQQPQLAPAVPSCITGIVTERGTAVPGMQVSLSDSPPNVSGDCPCAHPAPRCACREGLALLPSLPRAGLIEAVKSAITDQQGRFELCGVEGTAPRLIWAEHLDGRFAAPSRETSPLINAGAFVELRVVTMLPARGVVLANQTPVPQATVLAFFEPPLMVRAFTTDTNGHFETTLPLGTSDFVVSAANFPSQRVAQQFDPRRALVLQLESAAQLTVRVRFEGRPVAGAEVVVAPEAPRLSDAQGLAQFALQARARPLVRATKGELLGTTTVTLLEGQATRTIDVTLEQGLRLSGVVVDEEGKPHTGKVRGFGGKPVVTDEQGRFTTAALRVRDEFNPVAFAEGCDDSEYQTVQVKPAATLTLKLRCRETANGVVLDADGKPLADVNVTLDGIEHHEEVITDATGSFRFHQPAAMYQLKVKHERYRAHEQPLQLPAKDVTIVLDAGGSIAGTVVDGKKLPLPGVQVTVVPAVLDALMAEVEGGNTSATTDAEGHFLVSGLLAGRLVVSATGNSLGTSVSDVVVLQPAEHREGVVITLDEQVDLTGVVMDEQRRPIPGALVRWDPADEKSALMGVLMDAVRGHVDAVMKFMPSPSNADSEGRYQLRGLPVSSVKVGVIAGGYAEAEKIVSRGDTVDFVLTKQGGRVRGRVVDEAGRPLPQFTVDSAAFTADDGRFEVEVFSQENALYFVAPGFSRLTLPVKLDSPVKDIGEVVMKKGHGLRIEARSEGKPLAGVKVAAAQSGDGDTCLTDPDGTCVIEPLLDVETLVKAVKEGYAPTSATVAAGKMDQPVTLNLQPARGRITGVAFGAPGQPAAARSVFISGEITRGVLTEVNGRFLAEGLPEGPYCVSLESRTMSGLEWASSAQASTSPRAVSLGPDARGAVLTGSRTLPGRVVLLQGQVGPQSIARVLERSASNFCAEFNVPAVTTMTTGDFRIEGLPAGKWSAFFVSFSQVEDKGDVQPVALELLPGDVKQF